VDGASKRGDRLAVVSEGKKSSIVGIVLPLVFILPIAGVFLWEAYASHVHGTTPEQLAAASLEGSPKKVAKQLALTDADNISVRAQFKKGTAKHYVSVELDWTSGTSSAPYRIRLHPEHAKEDDDERAAALTAALAQRFHAMHDGQWSWGRFRISVDHEGEFEANVEQTWRDQPNPLFERQVDAAKQVMLEAAFGITPHASVAELAELLGTGYKIADVGKIDTNTTIEGAPTVIAARFPGSLHDDSSSWQVTVDHPLIEHVSLQWDNSRSGRLRDVRVFVTTAYGSSRETFQACLANILGAPQTRVSDYAAGQKNYVFDVGTMVMVLDQTQITLRGLDSASLSKIFEAFGSCHEKTENTASRGDGRKK
jgi:hypothetical protein